jgi:hypothetical protein
LEALRPHTPSLYLADSWNIFDFVVVIVSLLSNFPGLEHVPGISLLRLVKR